LIVIRLVLTEKTAGIVHYGTSHEQRPEASVPTAEFLTSAANARHFPPDSGREVAFVGRSNSGKSTALNLIAGAKVARVSKTPGRTQLINFFAFDQGRLVDLPGYGFARVAADVQARWRGVLEAYLRERESLVGLVLTMDIRRGVTQLDDDLLRWLEARRPLPLAVLLTKADKLGRGAASAEERRIAAALPQDTRVTRFSALTHEGVEQARTWLADWLADPGVKKPRVRDSGDAPGAPTPAG
jgi:GTP-binding protein